MQNEIITGNLKKVIINLTLPGYIGMLGMSIFNIVDTYYISILGDKELTAISYTFSVIMSVNLITIGLGIGMASLISKAVGAQDEEKKINVIMTGLLITMFVAITVSIVGKFNIDKIFGIIGASDEALFFIDKYMGTWFLGSTFLFLSMVSAQIFRGLGDTKTPGYLIVVAAAMNFVLDPLFIFVFDLGIQGAAIATVISRTTNCILSFYLLQKKYKVIQFSNLHINEMYKDGIEILKIGIPNSLAKIVNPLLIAYATSNLANISESSVAGFGVGTKIESFILAFSVAFANTTTAVVGQNYGARLYDRVKQAMNMIRKYSFVLFYSIYIVLFFTAPYIAKAFSLGNTSQEILDVTVLYLRILPLSYAFQSSYNSIVSYFNVIRKPILSTSLSVFQLVVIMIPLTNILTPKFGEVGVFISMLLSYVIVGVIAILISNKQLNKIVKQ